MAVSLTSNRDTIERLVRDHQRLSAEVVLLPAWLSIFLSAVAIGTGTFRAGDIGVLALPAAGIGASFLLRGHYRRRFGHVLLRTSNRDRKALYVAVAGVLATAALEYWVGLRPSIPDQVLAGLCLARGLSFRPVLTRWILAGAAIAAVSFVTMAGWPQGTWMAVDMGVVSLCFILAAFGDHRQLVRTFAQNRGAVYG